MITVEKRRQDRARKLARAVRPAVLTPGEARMCALEPGQRAATQAKITGIYKLLRAFKGAKRKRDGRMS